MKVSACVLMHPISNYYFLGSPFKNTLLYLYNHFFLWPQVPHFFDFTPIFFFLVSEPNYGPFFSYTALFSLYPIFFFGYVSIIVLHDRQFSSYNHDIVKFKPTSLRSHPSKYFLQKNYLFSSANKNPTLDPLSLVIVSMLFYMYWLDKRGHYMWWYFSCKHGTLFKKTLHYIYIYIYFIFFCKIYLQWIYQILFWIVCFYDFCQWPLQELPSSGGIFLLM